MLSKIIVFVFLFHVISCEIVSTETGQVQGTTLESWTGQSFHAFLGIPFAQPPIGEFRFRPPVPVEKWSGVHNGTELGPICMQPSPIPDAFVMSEDCLKLNIFTKNLPSNDTVVELKPVIVFFHGGGLERGSANSERAHYIIDRDIVFVTINYRLGALGFLATGTEDSAGNMGLKDGILALNWIKTNINYFGGNPDKITISGLSAGGYTITALMASPLTEGLFQGVISMSGAITWQMGLANHHLDTAINLGKQLDCVDENPTELVSCLRTKSAEDIASINLSELTYCAIMKWLPVVEPFFGQERVLIEDPNDSFRNGRFHRVPVIVGITTNEYTNPVPDVLSTNNVDLWNENFAEMLSYCCFYSNGRNIQAVGDILRKAYLPFDTIDIRSFNSLGHLLADGIIGIGVHRFVQFASNYTDIYYYKFSYIGRFSYFYYPRQFPFGTHHIDDVQYIIFAAVITPKMYSQSDPESIVIETMTRIWEQFAWYGNPNNVTKEYLNDMVWPKHDSENEFYLDIGTHLVEKNGLYLERYSVWDNLPTDAGNNFKLSFVAFSLLVMSFII